METLVQRRLHPFCPGTRKLTRFSRLFKSNNEIRVLVEVSRLCRTEDGGRRSRRTSSPDRCSASVVASPSKRSSERLLPSLFIFSLCSSVTPCLPWRYELWVVPEAKSADQACRGGLGGGAKENVSNQCVGGGGGAVVATLFQLGLSCLLPINTITRRSADLVCLCSRAAGGGYETANGNLKKKLAINQVTTTRRRLKVEPDFTGCVSDVGASLR